MPELRDFRKDGIGGSDSNILMGTAPRGWGSPFQLWEEKCLGIVREKDNPAMRYGREQEDEIRAELSRHLGTMLAPDQWVSPKRPWFRGNVDAIDASGKYLGEIKTAGKEDHELVKSQKRPPDKYYPQCQHYIQLASEMGMDIDTLYYASSHKGEVVIIEVPRDEDYIKKMQAVHEEFWQHVESGTPPKLLEQDYTPMESEEWRKLAWEMKEIKTTKKTLEEREDEILAEFKVLSGGVSARGGCIELQKQIVKGAIDYRLAVDDYLDNMRAHHPEIDFRVPAYEMYRKKPFEKWRVSVIS